MNRYSYIDEMTPAEFDDYMLRHRRHAYAIGLTDQGPGDSKWLALAVAVAIVAFTVACILT